MESLASIAFTDEDLAALRQGLDLLKEQTRPSRSTISPSGFGSDSVFYDLFMLRKTMEAAQKVKREEQEEMIITLQYKLLRFKTFLKQPDVPAS